MEEEATKINLALSKRVTLDPNSLQPIVHFSIADEQEPEQALTISATIDFLRKVKSRDNLNTDEQALIAIVDELLGRVEAKIKEHLTAQRKAQVSQGSVGKKKKSKK